MRWPFRGRPLEADTYDQPTEQLEVPIATRRILLTPEDVRAGHSSWLRLDSATGALESILYFNRGPSYAARLPDELARLVVDFTDLAMAALEPLLAVDLKPNGGTTT